MATELLERALEPQTELTYVPVSRYRTSAFLVRQFPAELLRARKILPLAREGDELVVATADPSDDESLAFLRRLAASRIRPVVSSASEIEIALEQLLAPERPPAAEPAVLRLAQETGFFSPKQVASIVKKRPEGAAAGASASEAERLAMEETDYCEALSLALYVPRLRLSRFAVNKLFASLVPRELAEQSLMVPVFPIGTHAVVAVARPPSDAALQQFKKATGFEPHLAVATPADVQRVLRDCYETPPKPKAEAVTPSSLSEKLVDAGYVAEAQMTWAKAISAHTYEPVEQVLLRQGHVTEHQIKEARARSYGTRYVELANVALDGSLCESVPEQVCRRCQCLPVRRLPQGVQLAMVDPRDEVARELFEFLLGARVLPLMCDPEDLDHVVALIYAGRKSSPEIKRLRLGEYLVLGGRLTAEQVDRGLHLQSQSGELLGKCLIKLGLLDEEGLTEILALQEGVPRVTVARYSPSGDILDVLSEEFARQNNLLPLHHDKNLLTVVAADATDRAPLEQIRQYLGIPARVLLAEESSIRTAVDRVYGLDLSTLSSELKAFGDELVRLGLVTRGQLYQVWRKMQQENIPFDTAVVELGMLTEQQICKAMAEYLGVPAADLKYQVVPEEVVDSLGVSRTVLKWREPVEHSVGRMIPEEMALSLAVVPVAITGNMISVAFVNPLEEETRQAVLGRLRSAVAVVVGTRSEIMEAIRRVHGHQTLGDLLIQADAITRGQLEEGLEMHRRTGVPLGRALISLGHLTQEQMASVLSDQRKLAFFSLGGVQIDQEVARVVAEPFCRQHGVLPLERVGDKVTVAMVNPLDTEAMAGVQAAFNCRVDPVICTEDDLEDALERLYRSEYLWQSANELVYRYPEDSASRVLSTPQVVCLVAFVIISAILIAIDSLAYFVVLFALSTVFYLSFSIYKFYLVYKAISHTLEVDVTPEEVVALDERELPIYTVLIPLYMESEVLPTLVQAIDDLDYPKAKLDVKLLLEEDDKETIEAVREHGLPAHFRPVVVPHGLPKGKPKACNYGLIHAVGEYVVIYDAEDIPERDQLKKVLIGFRKASPRVQCIQAKLNYYNRDQNLLTRWFTTEYSMWFDLFIPGLDASNAPIPLGGTSNHFRTSVLKELGAWDPFNVTEDADLGMRLYKAGWKTAVVDSTTYEEANCEIYNWIRQRSRWVKGYVQTWLVHMRHPLQLLRDIGPYAFFSFNMVVGGTFFGFLMNPIFWLLTASWYLLHPEFIQKLFPGPIFYMGAFGLYIGNFAFMYTNVAGCLRRRYYDMVKYALISPLYWALMSIGAWKGFIQLLYKPSYWEKTKHGLYQGGAAEAKAAVAAKEQL